MFVVFDLDGVLADLTHRLHYITGEKKNYHAFFEACDLDVSITHMVDTLKQFAARNDCVVEIWSGRSETVRDKTERWLLDRDIMVGYPPIGIECMLGADPEPTPPPPPYRIRKLRMRAAGDKRHDHVIKPEWLGKSNLSGVSPHRAQVRYENHPDLIFEDRRSVVDTWRSLGLMTVQPAPGDF